MIDLLFVGFAFGCAYVGLGLFGYHSAIGHVNRLLDIDEPDGPPAYLREAKRDLGEDAALSPKDIDRIEDWDDWEQ